MTGHVSNALKLTGYTKAENSANIADTDTLGEALSKLQTQIIAEENARAAAIENLDSSSSQEAGTDGLALTLEIVDGKISTLSGSIASNTYDAYGEANKIKGQSTDTADAYTVYGAHARIQNVESAYIKQTDAPGYEDILTTANAQSLYIQKNTEFEYDANDTIKTLQEIISDLNRRITDLENKLLNSTTES